MSTRPCGRVAEIKGLPKVKNIYIKALKILLKTGLNRFFDNFFKRAQKGAKFQNRQVKTLSAKWFKKSPKWLQIAKSGSTV